MSTDDKSIDIRRGLNGVYFDRSAVSSIDGRAGELRYRGYSIHDLARHSTFEEICYLLMHGELPNVTELDGFDQSLKAARVLPEPVYEVIRATKDAHPMEVLRTAASGLGAWDEEVDDNSAEATLRKGVRLTAQVPAIVAAHHRIRNGHEPVQPSEDLAHAANFLYMLKGEQPSENVRSSWTRTWCYTRSMAPMHHLSRPGSSPARVQIFTPP